MILRSPLLFSGPTALFEDREYWHIPAPEFADDTAERRHEEMRKYMAAISEHQGEAVVTQPLPAHRL